MKGHKRSRSGSGGAGSEENKGGLSDSLREDKKPKLNNEGEKPKDDKSTCWWPSSGTPGDLRASSATAAKATVAPTESLSGSNTAMAELANLVNATPAPKRMPPTEVMSRCTSKCITATAFQFNLRFPDC